MSDHHVVIRADASAEIGVGHVARCITLARVLRAEGLEPQFVCVNDAGPLVRELADSFDVECIGVMDERSDAEASVRAGPGWVIVDHLHLGACWEMGAREAGCRVVVIDDLRDRPHCADLLVSDLPLPFTKFSEGCNGEGRQLIGPEYAIISEEFTADAAGPSSPPFRILVSYGGSDPTGETGKALDAIEMMRNTPAWTFVDQVTVIVGPANSAAGAISERASMMGGITIAQSPRSIAPYLRNCDLFLTAGGQSMIEALSVRRACLVTTTAPNQVPSVTTLSERGLVRSLGLGTHITCELVAHEIPLMLNSILNWRTRLLASPFDPLGAQRIVDEMLTSRISSAVG